MLITYGHYVEKYVAIFEKSVEISQKSLVRTFTTHISSTRLRSFSIIDLAREKGGKIMEENYATAVFEKLNKNRHMLPYSSIASIIFCKPFTLGDINVTSSAIVTLLIVPIDCIRLPQFVLSSISVMSLM